VFKVADAEYALPIDEVVQMETFAGATAVPGVPAYVSGIMTIRGQVVPVIDLRLRFGLEPAALTLDTRVVVTQSHGRTVALRVDSAREVLKLNPEQHQPAPSVLGEHASGFVYAVHSLGERLLMLVDLSKLLGETSHEQQHHPLLDDRAKERPALPG
jgi:purine-binding chemotaxis protein CheW